MRALFVWLACSLLNIHPACTKGCDLQLHAASCMLCNIFIFENVRKPYKFSASLPDEPFYTQWWFQAVVGVLLALVLFGFVLLLCLQSNQQSAKHGKMLSKIFSKYYKILNTFLVYVLYFFKKCCSKLLKMHF